MLDPRSADEGLPCKGEEAGRAGPEKADSHSTTRREYVQKKGKASN